MGRTGVIILFSVLVVAVGSAVALAWWSLADRFFPGAARSTGQGLRRRRHSPGPPPTVIRGFDRPPPHAR